MIGHLRRRTFAIGAAIALLPSAGLAADGISQQQMAWEMQAGQQQYAQLMQRGEIVPQSPYYAALQPVGLRVAAVADPQYFAPFRFILVNEGSPNAFSAPGGNVYVTTSLMQYARNQDELAGVLCHEVAHDIHHDVYNNHRKMQGLQTMAGILGAVVSPFMGPYGMIGQAAVGAGAGATAMSYSRADETNADHAGAYVCAQAGYNPWGMVWLFQQMAQTQAQNPQRSGNANNLEMFSDHPRDDHRVSDLESLFRSDPATFGRYADNPSAAAPLATPAPMPAYPQQGYPPPPG